MANQKRALIWGVSLGGGVALIGVGFFIVLFLMSRAPRNQVKESLVDSTDDLPDWKPDSALLEDLGQEVTVGNYRLRPPVGYILEPAPDPAPGAKLFAWGSPPRPDGTRALITVTMAITPANQPTLPTESWLEMQLNSIKQRRTTWNQTAVEKGLVNGMVFLRARWSGKNPGLQRMMHGFCYTTVDDRASIIICSQDLEPDHEKPLQVAEAAARTFRKP